MRIKTGVVIGVFSLFMLAATVGLLVPVEQAKLTAGDGSASDGFGSSVAVSGDTAIVGVPWDDDLGDSSGAAYIFQRNGTRWIQAAKLTASDGELFDGFGFSVAISGDTAVVGAPWDDLEAGAFAGSAYIFQRTGREWTEVAKLTSGEVLYYGEFGLSVGISGDAAIIGAGWFEGGGAAYIFERSGITWTRVEKLYIVPWATGYGTSVAISGDTAVVGAHRDRNLGVSSGSAYLYQRNGNGWTEMARLNANDGEASDGFGGAVSIRGDTVIVSAPGDDDLGSHSGSTYIFRNNGTRWIEAAKMTASDGAANDRFGTALAINGDTIIVGAPGDDDLGGSSGSAYIFQRIDREWVEVAKLTASDGAPNDGFGRSVASHQYTAIVGASGDDDQGYNSGSAYIYVLP